MTEVWLSGTRYHPIPENIVIENEQTPETPAEIEQEQFLSDFKSKLWCSYRRGFENIGTTRYTSDSGWGCMLRSGQMMLGGALIRHFLGPQWRLDQNATNEEVAKKYQMIVSWFADRQGSSSPYSLSNMAIKGVKFDTPIGQWHGPTTTAYILKMLVSQHSPGGLKAYVSQDATVYRHEITRLCEKERGSEDWHSVVIMLPVRLGIELNTSYLPFLAETFKFPQSLGFAGGKIGLSVSSVLTLGKIRTQRAVRSMYFIGADDHDGLFYLDPHKTQDAVQISNPDEVKSELFSSYHFAAEPKKTTIDQIDPSLVLGFYCRNKKDFEDFCMRVEKLNEEKKPAVFVLGKKKPVYSNDPNILVEENDLTMKWQAAGDWAAPYKSASDLSTSSGNPRPEPIHPDLMELATFHSSNGEVYGVIILAQGYLLFEPLKQDPLARKNGLDSYRWWIRVPFIEDCKVLAGNFDAEDGNSDDFIILHSETEHVRSLDELDPTNSEPLPLAASPSREYLAEEHKNEKASSHRGLGANPNVSLIVHAVDIKALLIDELKASVNWCHFAFLRMKGTLSEVLPEVSRLLISLEYIFQHCLKERSNLASFSSQLADLTKGKTSTYAGPTFWSCLERVLCHEHIEFFEKEFSDASELEKCRAWIRLALNEGVLYNYFISLVSDPRLMQQSYTPKAILMDGGHCEVLKTLFSSLQDLTFNLPLVGLVHQEKLSPPSEREESLSTPEPSSDIPFLTSPCQIRIVVKNGPVHECFDIEVPSDRISKICDPIHLAIGRFRAPMAKS